MRGRYWCLFNKKYYITEKSLFLYQVYLGRGWEERKLSFFLEKQKQAVLLTVIDKAGRKKCMKYTLRLINTGKSIQIAIHCHDVRLL